jgi:uncharacterized protein YbbC (DUF1343 family)
VSVQVGLEVLVRDRLGEVAGQRLGLVASPSSVDADLASSVDVLHGQPGTELAALFGPEHGLRGEAQAGEKVGSSTDTRTGLPVYSLYGATRTPTAEMLDGLDTIVFDLQDGGLRFYTYLSTLAHVMEAAAEHGTRVVVLDRPVYLGGTTVEGGLVEDAFRSFVGLYPLPIRYGMTAGEIARLLALEHGIDCELHVVPMRGWRREMWFDDTGFPFVPPSPNLPTLSAITVYPGTCLVEGTNLSEGRGTTKPFEYVGAPYLDGYELARSMNRLELPGVRFREVFFVPTFSKHLGETCSGVQLHVTNRGAFEPLPTAVHLISTVRRLWPERFGWRAPWAEGGHHPIDLLSGSSRLRGCIDAAEDVTTLLADWKEESRRFEDLRARYLLYETNTHSPIRGTA